MVLTPKMTGDGAATVELECLMPVLDGSIPAHRAPLPGPGLLHREAPSIQVLWKKRKQGVFDRRRTDAVLGARRGRVQYTAEEELTVDPW